MRFAIQYKLQWSLQCVNTVIGEEVVRVLNVQIIATQSSFPDCLNEPWSFFRYSGCVHATWPICEWIVVVSLLDKDVSPTSLGEINICYKEELFAMITLLAHVIRLSGCLLEMRRILSVHGVCVFRYEVAVLYYGLHRK